MPDTAPARVIRRNSPVEYDGREDVPGDGVRRRHGDLAEVDGEDTRGDIDP